MANNPYVNKIEFGGQVKIDLTNDTAEAGDVLSGKSFHLRSGAQAQGTLTPPTSGVYNAGTADSTTSTPTIASVVSKFGTDHALHNNMTGQFNISSSNPPSDLPAQTAEWKYSTGYIAARYIDNSGVIDTGAVFLFSNATKKIAINMIYSSGIGDSWMILTGADATTSASGLMSATDKSKLDGIQAGAQVNPGNATQSAAGLMSAADKTKLDGVSTGAKTIKSDTVNGTTNGYGFFISNVSTDIKIIETYADRPIVIWPYSGAWVFGALDFSTSGLKAAVNTAVTVTYYYYE